MIMKKCPECNGKGFIIKRQIVKKSDSFEEIESEHKIICKSCKGEGAIMTNKQSAFNDLNENKETLGNYKGNQIFKLNEDEYLKEVEDYIKSTYKDKYGISDIQPIEFMIQSGVGVDFCRGNIIKYVNRWQETQNRKDLMKLTHYAILLLISNDKNKE